MLSGPNARIGAALAALWLVGVALPPATAAGQGGPAGPAGLVIELSGGARAAVQPPTVSVTGGLTARHGELVIQADRLEYDDGTGVAVFSGRVRLTRPGQAVEGERLVYDLRRGRAEASQATVEVVAQGVRGPVYLQAPQVMAESDRVAAAQAELTTCPLPVHEAHYRVRVSRLEVEPGRWVRAYDAVLVDSGIPLFYWPYLSFSLANPRSGRFGPPSVGYGAREGWYVRMQIPYMGPADRYGYLNLDYYQKLGPGVGVYQALYDDGLSWVAAYLHAIPASAERQVPDIMAGVEGEAAAGGGRLAAAISLTQLGQGGGVATQQGRLSGRAEAPEWGLSGTAAGLVERQPGESAPSGAWQGRWSLQPPSPGPLRLAASGRWDVNTLPRASPPRVLWDLEAGLRLDATERLVVSLQASRTSHPDLYAGPAGSTEWLFVERLPELSAEYRAVEADLGPLPVALVTEVSAARVAETRPADPGAARRPVGTEGERVEDGRLTGEARLEAGPARLGPVELRASSGLWSAWYASAARQAAARSRVQIAYHPVPGLELDADYRHQQPVALGGSTADPAGQGSGGAGTGSSPFRFDRVEGEEALSLGASLGRQGPVGAQAVARLGRQGDGWEVNELSVAAHAGRGSALSAAVSGLYLPPEQRWDWVVASLELKTGAVQTALAGRLRPQAGRWDRLAARVTWRLPGQVSLTAGAELKPDLPPQEQGELGWAERADLEVALRLGTDWVVSGAVAYSRQLGGWLRSEVGLALDQDCRAVALRYDPQQKRVALAYQIKAFPQVVAAVASSPEGPVYDPGQWDLLLGRLEEGR